jgi:folate-binding protein YgfZ
VSLRDEGADLHVLGEDGHAAGGYSVVVGAPEAAGAWRRLEPAVRSVGGSPTGDAVVEACRILRGLPSAGHELTEDHNPLEAGLWDAVSFDKGCYVGQEVIARLRTYDKVARALVGLELPPGSDPPLPGTRLFLDGREVGELTSAAAVPGRRGPVGLGYVKRKELGPALELRVGGSEAERVARVVELPFPAPGAL